MFRRTLMSLGVCAVLFLTAVFAANDPLETVEVTSSREKMRCEIQSFVHKVTRLEGVYRASYSPKDQQRDIEARMVRELAPR